MDASLVNVLPTEITTELFSFLDPISRARFGSTCRGIRSCYMNYITKCIRLDAELLGSVVRHSVASLGFFIPLAGESILRQAAKLCIRYYIKGLATVMRHLPMELKCDWVEIIHDLEVIVKRKKKGSNKSRFNEEQRNQLMQWKIMLYKNSDALERLLMSSNDQEEVEDADDEALMCECIELARDSPDIASEKFTRFMFTHHDAMEFVRILGDYTSVYGPAPVLWAASQKRIPLYVRYYLFEAVLVLPSLSEVRQAELVGIMSSVSPRGMIAILAFCEPSRVKEILDMSDVMAKFDYADFAKASGEELGCGKITLYTETVPECDFENFDANLAAFVKHPNVDIDTLKYCVDLLPKGGIDTYCHVTEAIEKECRFRQTRAIVSGDECQPEHDMKENVKRKRDDEDDSERRGVAPDRR